MKRIRRLNSDETGSTLVEMALCTPLLLLILFGAVDLGRIFYTTITLTSAAVAGAQYGVVVAANNTDFSGMQQAALNDASNISGVTAAATGYCECLDGTSVACSGTTCNGVAPPKYVKVTTTATFATLFSYPLIPSSVALSGSSVQRAR